MKREYVMAYERVDSFESGVVRFWIRQEMLVRKGLVEQLVVILRWFVLVYGTREVTRAGVVREWGLVARFEVTFPGI